MRFVKIIKFGLLLLLLIGNVCLASSSPVILEARDVTISYGDNPAVIDVSFSMAKHKITAIIGPSGCGKSTLLRAFNRMNDFIPEAKMDGKILYLDKDLYSKGTDPVECGREDAPASVLQRVLHGKTLEHWRETDGDGDADGQGNDRPRGTVDVVAPDAP